MSSMKLHAEQRQQPTLSPRLQQALRLLQLSSTEFAQTVEGALQTNPFLDTLDDDDGLPADAALAQALDSPLESLPGDDGAGDTAGEIPPPASADEDRDSWVTDGLPREAGPPKPPGH